METMKLSELKAKSPAELLTFAEEYEVENASTMRKQELMFAILKELAAREVEIVGEGVVEVLPDGFGFLRSPDANYLPGPDDIYVSPSQIRRFSLRTGDTVEGEIRSPKEGERYFALLKVTTINFEDPEKVRHKVNFDNLTPLYPEERIRLELPDPTVKDKSARVMDLVAPDRQGPARPDRRAAAHRQDRAAAEHRAVDRDQPPRMLPHRAAHRRAPGGSHRHAALGEAARSSPRPSTSRRARHVQVAEMVIEKAKRLVEHKRDVVILLDSITRLGRAYNTVVPILGQGADRRRRRQRPAAPEALLRRGAQHRRWRLADHHRDGADRYRLAHGRSDLRRIQGHG